MLFRDLAGGGGGPQERDKDLGDRIEEGLGPRGLGIISIAGVSRTSCNSMHFLRRKIEVLDGVHSSTAFTGVSLALCAQVPGFPELRKSLLRLAPRHVVILPLVSVTWPFEECIPQGDRI